MNIIVKSYEHFNRSLPDWDSPHGKYIGSRVQYEKELARSGLVSFEQAEQSKANPHKDYNGISKEAMEVCIAAKQQADKKGNLRIGSRLKQGMEKVGVSFDFYNKLPAHYSEIPKGGFE